MAFHQSLHRVMLTFIDLLLTQAKEIHRTHVSNFSFMNGYARERLWIANGSNRHKTITNRDKEHTLELV